MAPSTNSPYVVPNIYQANKNQQNGIIYIIIISLYFILFYFLELKHVLIILLIKFKI